MFPVEAFRSTLEKAVRIFRRYGIRFHLTGGIASVYYGEPRLTQDIDIVIDNAQLAAALDSFLHGVAVRGGGSALNAHGKTVEGEGRRQVTVMPAQAGTQAAPAIGLDSRLRGNDTRHHLGDLSRRRRLPGNWHGLAHGAGKKGGHEKLGHFDEFLTEQLSYFLTRLAEPREGDGTLLDRTLVFYGSSNSKTHRNVNYPLLLAGGQGLGIKHEQYHRFSEKSPLANLFVTMLDRIVIPVESFADSTGELSEIV